MIRPYGKAKQEGIQGVPPCASGRDALDTFSLALADKGPLELGKRTHNRQHRISHWRIFTGKTQVFLNEFYMHASLRQYLHDAAQIIEIARQAIHAMYKHNVAGARETHQRIQFRALGILTRCFVCKKSINLDAVQLTFRVLVESADSDIPNTLSDHDSLPHPTSMFSIKRTIVSFCVGADSATSRANAARPMSLITGCLSRIS